MKCNIAAASITTKVHAGYHAYGYWVEATAPGGHSVKREEYGNSPFESTAVFSLKSGGTLELPKLRDNANRTAQALPKNSASPPRTSAWHMTPTKKKACSSNWATSRRMRSAPKAWHE